MAEYYPIIICRSDGLLEVTTKQGVREKNQPTAKQLDDTPDENGMVDCYKKLDPDEPKAVDWRRKIGGMLMQYLAGKDYLNRNWILKELPEDYILWEHVKYKTDKGAEDKKKEKGKHAAGVFERQDAYLYGHPEGRKKRYRSPADFMPHVLWLATDKEGDRRNCSCKICSPDGDEETQDTIKVETPVKKEIKAQLPMSVAPKSLPAAKPTLRAPPSSTTSSPEQRLDAEPNGKYLFRPGELVWFNKVGGNWGLGVISKRQALPTPRYLIQPLSHPLFYPPYEIKEREDQLRPWLAWSVPPLTHRQLSNLTFDQVPWEQIISPDSRSNPTLLVDGSILAAKAIDSSYSLFDRVDNALAAPGEVHYNGMFLGAEKIWAGEPLRLRGPGNDAIVLVIQKLIERTTPPSTSEVTFVGDVYKFVEMPMPYKNRSQWPTPALPPRMVADLLFRNEVADAANKGVWYEWRLLEPAAKKKLPDVKGRWYESRTLLPMLRGAAVVQADLAQGNTSDAGMWMNGRGDSSSMTGQRKKNRRDTLGRAVPPDFKASRGLDGPKEDDAFPDAQTNQKSQEQQRLQEIQRLQEAQRMRGLSQPKFVEHDIEQYMDLDQASGQSDFFGNEMQH